MDLTKRNYIRLNFERALHDGHIDVHYRPILRTATERICGVEALSRWHDPLYGEIAPHDFVRSSKISEKSICSITLY